MKVIKINKLIFFILFKRLFNKGNRKHFFRVPIEFIETLVEVWEKLQIAWKHTHFLWGGGAGPADSYSPVFELLTTIAHRHIAGVSEKGFKAQFSLLSGGF